MLLSQTGKWLIIAGAGLMFFGVLLWIAGKTGLPFGRLPGDIRFERENYAFYFPVVTCIVLSILLTVLVNIVLRFFR